MAQVGEFATPAAVPLPHRFKRKGRRSRRIRPVKPVTVQVYENPQRTVIEYRMKHYGLTEQQAKHEKAWTELGRLWLLGRITTDQREAGERYHELHDAHLRAIKAPVGLRKTAPTGDSDQASIEYVEWAIAAEAKWAVFRMNSLALEYVVIDDQPVSGLLLIELRLALQKLAVRFGLIPATP